MADSSGGLRFISLAEREEVYSFQAGNSRIIDLAFTADGANLLTLSEDGAVRLWGWGGRTTDVVAPTRISPSAAPGWVYYYQLTLRRDGVNWVDEKGQNT